MTDGAWTPGELDTLLYEELRRIARLQMRGERRAHTLQPTELVGEVWTALAGKQRAFNDREHFLARAAIQMRCFLVDYARRRRVRDGGLIRVSLGDDLAAPERSADLFALNQALFGLEQRFHRKYLVAIYRFFGGLEEEEVVRILRVSRRTVQNDWAFARAWLERALAAKE